MERGLDPLTARLVVADPTRTEKTICLAVSPALKAYGISGRARLFEVLQKVKQVEAQTGEEISFHVAPPRMGRYIEVSAEIYEIYLSYISAEDIHVYSIDECFMDVTDYLDLYHMNAHDLAMTMIRDVLEHTGITATAGIGTNLYLCKIAMDVLAKHVQPDKDGVRIASLDEMSYRKYLWDHTPLTDFWRIGQGTVKRLSQCGMYTMGDIARTSIENEDLLYKIFGIDAELLIDHAWGYEPCTMKSIKAFRPQTNSISSGQVLQEPYDFTKTRIVVKEMTDQMVLELVEKKKMTDSVTVTIGFDRVNLEQENTTYQGEIHIDRYGRMVPKAAHGTANLGEPTNSTKRIMEQVLSLYDRIVPRDLLSRRITLSANNLSDESEYEQLDLFSDLTSDKKERALQEAMLSIKKKYGKNAILKGTNLEEGATARDRNQQIGGHRA
ncbi:MAG: DNA methylase [Lachnospiraceae bacterium]|nr:DNA methylase [Lachnospiraceae bacterium]